ncbi:unnamed protein product [Adineta steineri]|uniref:Uncharacterized protein n=1 Tax=Adineta steineri TaxID=433720 RepID=A0A815G430_9BILA|nr:unnamed protein product [Adineta steineri]
MCNGRSMNEISRNTIANIFKDLKDQKVDLPPLRFSKHAPRGEAADFSSNPETRGVLTEVNAAKNDLHNELADFWKNFKTEKDSIGSYVNKYILRGEAADSSLNPELRSVLDESNAGKKKLHHDINAAKNDITNELADIWRKLITDKASIGPDVRKHARRGEAADFSMNPKARGVVAEVNAAKNDLHDKINTAKTDLHNELDDIWKKLNTAKGSIESDIDEYIRRGVTADSSENLETRRFAPTKDNLDKLNRLLKKLRKIFGQTDNSKSDSDEDRK